MELRSYQSKFIGDIAQAYAQGAKSPAAVLPTGGGKGLVAQHIAKGSAAKGNVVGLLAHRAELISQLSMSLASAGVWHYVVGPEKLRRAIINKQISKFGRSFYNTDAPTYVASVQTLARRLDTSEAPSDSGLMIYDEGHHCVAGQWKKIIEANPKAKRLMLTATPERLDGKGLGVSAGGYCDALVMGPRVKELIALGYLSQPRVFSPPSKLDFSDLRFSGSDYARADNAKLMDQASITGDVIQHYRRLANGLPAIAFCVTVKHAKHVAEQFSAAGFKAACVDGNMLTSERDRAIEDLGRGRLHVLTSCDIVSEGTDIPIVAAAIMLRRTESLALYLQQAGRVLRPFEGKEYSIILDHVGNSDIHGLPDEDREWSLEGRKKRKRNLADDDDEADLKAITCMDCYGKFSSSESKCPWCGAEVLSAKSKPPKEVDGELIEVDEESLRLRRRSEQGMATTKDDLVALGRRKGYANPEFWADKVLRGRKNKSAPLLAMPRG